jgi:hypothetical protein
VFFDTGQRVGEIAGGRGTSCSTRPGVVGRGHRRRHLAFVNFEIRADSAFYDRVAKVVVTHGRAVADARTSSRSRGTGMTVDLGAETLQDRGRRRHESSSAHARARRIPRARR